MDRKSCRPLQISKQRELKSPARRQSSGCRQRLVDFRGMPFVVIFGLYQNIEGDFRIELEPQTSFEMAEVQSLMREIRSLRDLPRKAEVAQECVQGISQPLPASSSRQYVELSKARRRRRSGRSESNGPARRI